MVLFEHLPQISNLFLAFLNVERIALKLSSFLWLLPLHSHIMTRTAFFTFFIKVQQRKKKRSKEKKKKEKPKFGFGSLTLYWLFGQYSQTNSSRQPRYLFSNFKYFRNIFRNILFQCQFNILITLITVALILALIRERSHIT